MGYEPPRIRPVKSTLSQAFGTTCSPGASAGGSDICFPTGASADPGICTDGSRAYQGQCSTGQQAWGGPCTTGQNTGGCSTGNSAYFSCGTGHGDLPWTTGPETPP
jgi:hypothetical protein